MQTLDKYNQAIFLGLFIVYSALAVVQLLLGTGVLYVLLMMTSVIIVALIVFLFGMYNLSSLLAVALLAKYSLSPFLLKTIIGERIDEGLWTLDESFFVLTLGSALVFLALFLANSISIKGRLLAIPMERNELKRFGRIFFSLGLIFALLHVNFVPRFMELGRQSAGFGGFGDFISFMYLGIILHTNYLISTKKNKVFDSTLAVMLGAVLTISVIANVKLHFVMSILSYVATIFLFTPGYFGSKRGLKHLGYIILFLVFFVYVMAPTVHAMRIAGIYKELTIAERIEFILSGGGAWQEKIVTSMKVNDVNLKYFDTIENPLVDRLSMIEDMDLVISGTNESNRIGFEPIVLAVKGVIPGFLQTNKPNYSDGDLIGYSLGIAHGLGGWLMTVGVFAVAYAMFMWPGWMIVVFSVYLLWFLLLRKVVNTDLKNNIWAIYFLIKYGFLFTENSVQAMLQIMIRNIPLDIFMIYLIFFIGGKFRFKSN